MSALSYDSLPFTCEDCGLTYPAYQLRLRDTMHGQYCPECSDREKCGACGEVYPKAFMSWKDDVSNYICEDCQHDYKEVRKYIKPLVNSYRHQPVMQINR
ncbi:MAG TPA: hypothetical protein VG603_01380 [Chitinophagales bacterium]|nr:hypothetical protein [Chitinophagales bacterium]